MVFRTIDATTVLICAVNQRRLEEESAKYIAMVQAKLAAYADYGYRSADLPPDFYPFRLVHSVAEQVEIVRNYNEHLKRQYSAAVPNIEVNTVQHAADGCAWLCLKNGCSIPSKLCSKNIFDLLEKLIAMDRCGRSLLDLR